MTPMACELEEAVIVPVERNILKIHEELGKTGTLLIVKQNDPDFYLQHRWVGKFERT